MVTDDGQGVLPLPGLEPEAKPSGALTAAVRRTIASLEGMGVLGERHAASCALALALAATMDNPRAMTRASAQAMAARELREVLGGLLDLAEGDGDDDPWKELAQAFAAMDGQGAT